MKNKSLLRTKSKDEHLKNAFTDDSTPTKNNNSKHAMIRVQTETRDEINAIVQVKKLDNADQLISKLLKQFVDTLTDEEKEKVNLLIELKR